MESLLGDALTLNSELGRLDPKSPRYAVEAVESILAQARRANASDVHLHPTPEGLELRTRVDGVLHLFGILPASVAPNVVARLKVLADLLTYRSDLPQEGRVRSLPGVSEVRVSTFPTLHGERAVVRLFAGSGRFLYLADLGLPDDAFRPLVHLLDETSGAIVLSGPAGSGKTTTIYACLRDLVRDGAGGRGLATLEDPIEGAVAGVSQSQVNPSAGFDLATGLRSILRQDPEVLVVGEVRDRLTAEIAFQASLTGHLVLTTFHAGSASGAVGRLLDMGIEPYLLRSGLLAVLSQRLARRLCPACVTDDLDPLAALGLPVQRPRKGLGCEACRGSGFSGRLVLAELLLPETHGIGQSILDRRDVREIERIAIGKGLVGRWRRAIDACEQGLTSPREVRRVLGFSDDPLDGLGQKS